MVKNTVNTILEASGLPMDYWNYAVAQPPGHSTSVQQQYPYHAIRIHFDRMPEVNCSVHLVHMCSRSKEGHYEPTRILHLSG